MSQRINKFISDTGFCARREADKMIEDERVTINHRPAQLGDMVERNDVVRIDGEILKPLEPQAPQLTPSALVHKKPVLLPKEKIEKTERQQGVRFEQLSEEAREQYGISPAINPKSKIARDGRKAIAKKEKSKLAAAKGKAKSKK